MSSKFKVLSIALVAVLALGVFVSTAKADVTGSFETHIFFTPQTTASEISLLDFDIQNALNVTVVISGLSTSFHTHFGIAGVEDVILTSSATLGALDIEATIVFGRFDGFCAVTNAVIGGAGETCLVPVWDAIPETDDLVFIKKRVMATLSLGGVTLSNLAIFEDTNFTAGNPESGQTPAFAFGDVLTVSGQTPSGISISASTGICAEQSPNVIKKHTWPYQVNPHCATEPKPDILFDFENMTISGIPIAPSIIGSANLNCETINACVLTTTVAFSGGPIPFSTSFTFTDLLTLTFGGAVLSLESGAGTLEIGITPTGEIGSVGVEVSATINPDTNPATFEIDATIIPGTGLTSADVDLFVQRAGLILGVLLDFRGGPPATFDDIVFLAILPGSVLSLEATTQFSQVGMDFVDILLTVSF